MPELSKKFPAAKFEPTGEVIAFLNVEPAQQRGPWTCPGQGCDMKLDYRSGTFRNVGGRRFPVSPFWARNSAEGNSHVSGCEAQPAERRGAAYWSERLGREIRRNETVLLAFGERAAPEPTSSGARTRSESGNVWEYAGRANSLTQLLQAFINAGGHGGMEKYFYTHDGVQYRWQDIAYSSRSSAYLNLTQKRSGLMHDQGNWPWIIGGTVGQAGFEVKNGERLGVNLYPSDEFGGAGNASRVALFCDNTDENQAMLKLLRTGARVVSLAHRLQLDERYQGGRGNLPSAEYIVPIDGLFIEDGVSLEF